MGVCTFAERIMIIQHFIHASSAALTTIWFTAVPEYASVFAATFAPACGDTHQPENINSYCSLLLFT